MHEYAHTYTHVRISYPGVHSYTHTHVRHSVHNSCIQDTQQYKLLGLESALTVKQSRVKLTNFIGFTIKQIKKKKYK